MIRRTSILVLLIGTLLLVGCGSSDGDSAAATTPASSSGVTTLTPTEGQALIAKEGAALTVIDVRTPEEFASGHLEGAVNMDLEGGQFSTLIQDLPKDGAYVVYCHSGRRSAIAADTMVAAGFTTIYDLGGIADWEAAGLPVVTG